MSAPDNPVPPPAAATSVKPGPLLLWTPRILGGLFIFFISMFALDAFAENRPLSQALIAFAIHLIPSAILLLILALCWRWPAAGALYLVLAGWYLAGAIGKFPLSVYFLIAGPPIVCGTLFIIQHLTDEKPRA